MNKRNKMKKKVTTRPKRKLMNEHVLGELPTEKLIKMKWNPLAKEKPVNEMTPTYGTGDVIHDYPKHVQHKVTGVPGEVVGHSLNESGEVNFIDVDYGSGKIHENLPISNFIILETQKHQHEVKEGPSDD
jgi:hypothetical protein